MKYRGIFLQTEIYNRWLDNFKADGPLPVASIHDTGFYVQAAFYPMPKKLELYGVTSQIYGDKSAGFEQQLMSTVVGLNCLPVQHPQSPPQRPGDRRQPVAGEQRVRLLHRRPEGHHASRPRSRSSSEGAESHHGATRLTLDGGLRVAAGVAILAFAAVAAVPLAARWPAPADQAAPAPPPRGECRVPRLALPPDQLHPGRASTSASSWRSWEPASAGRRCSASRCSSSGRTRNSGDFAPTYYLQSDAPLYYYSFTDAYIASSLPLAAAGRSRRASTR